MKHAREVIDLMGSYPGREWKKREIVNYCIGKQPAGPQRKSAQQAIWRVLDTLRESGLVEQLPGESIQASRWRWKITT